MYEGRADSKLIDDLLLRMADLLEPLERAKDPRRFFLATYSRTTQAVADAIERRLFVDNDWVERWDVAFADLYLDAVAAEDPPGPWARAFSADPELPALRQVLLGMNAHINFDLPQALLAVITDDEFDDPRLMTRRRADHERIDGILASRVSAEDAQLEGTRTVTDRLLTPMNRLATKRLLRESRRRVWRNAYALSTARREGHVRYTERLHELEDLSSERIADLMRPGFVLLRLAVRGFGVELDPPDPMRQFDPQVIGLAERDAWACYYRREWRAFLRAAVRMVHEGFGMSRVHTVRGAALVLRANQQWAPFPDNDPDGARATMERFYALVFRVHRIDLDPKVAARLEVDWWQAHRQAQHDPSVESADLVDALTSLYAYVYGVPGPDLIEAARLRAEAMRISDAWVAAGCAPASQALADEADLLVRSYGSLLTAVRRR